MLANLLMFKCSYLGEWRGWKWGGRGGGGGVIPQDSVFAGTYNTDQKFGHTLSLTILTECVTTSPHMNYGESNKIILHI